MAPLKTTHASWIENLTLLPTLKFADHFDRVETVSLEMDQFMDFN